MRIREIQEMLSPCLLCSSVVCVGSERVIEGSKDNQAVSPILGYMRGVLFYFILGELLRA